MSQLLVVSESEDQLKKLIKECVREVLSEKVPYSGPTENTYKVLTRKQAAKVLGVSANTITKYIKYNQLTASVFGGKYFINEKELIRFVNSNVC